MINYKKPFLIYAIASLAYLFPIIKADRYFIDDYNRAILGYLSWSDNGRPFADIIMTSINFGTIISDISPLTQILGVASLFLVVVFLTSKGSLDITKSVLCSLCIISSPFMMETLSYAYDSLPMLLSISFIFLAFLLKTDSTPISFAWHCLCIVLSMCLYQASMGIYVILALLCYIENENLDFNGFRALLSNAVSLIVSYVVYSKIIAPRFISGGYSIKRSEMIQLTSSDAIPSIISNIEKYIGFIKLGYPTPFLIVTAVVIVLGFYGLCVRAYTFFSRKNKSTIIASAITLLSPIAIAFMAIVPLSILAHPPLMSRVLMVVGAGAMFMMYYSLRCAGKYKNIISLCASFVFLSYSYSTIYAYGNAQARQKDFESYAIGLMQNDISAHSEVDVFDMYGSIPASPVSALIVSQHPIMSWLVLSNITFRDEWRTNITLKNYRFQATYKPGSYGNDIKNPTCKNMIRRFNGIYTLFKYNGVLLFNFSDKCK
ncbi:glucosyltransferase domain-containing protein [Enterobacter sichuanensis]